MAPYLVYRHLKYGDINESHEGYSGADVYIHEYASLAHQTSLVGQTQHRIAASQMCLALVYFQT